MTWSSNNNFWGNTQMQPPVLFPVQRTTAPVIYLGQFHQFQINQIKAEIKAETYLIVFLTCLPIVSQSEVDVHPHCQNVFLKLTKVPMTHKNSGINFLSNSWLSSRISKIKVSSIKTAMHIVTDHYKSIEWKYFTDKSCMSIHVAFNQIIVNCEMSSRCGKSFLYHSPYSDWFVLLRRPGWQNDLNPSRV